GVLGPPAVLAAAILTDSEELAKVFMLIFPWYFMGWLAAVLQVLDNLRKRSRGRLPPRPAQPGWAVESEQDGGAGDDLMLAEAREDAGAGSRPGRRGMKCARRPAAARPAGRIPADLRGTA